MKYRKLITISLITILLFTLGAVAVLAQDDEAEDPLTPREAQKARLAEALGISVEELEDAQQAAEIARITEAVEDGTLSNDQGNLMLAMITLKDVLDRQEMLASALGISVEELEEAMDEGELRDLMDQLTPAELREGLQSAFDETLDNAVDEMLITEDQAEMVREHLGDGFRFFHNNGRRSGPHGRFQPHWRR